MLTRRMVLLSAAATVALLSPLGGTRAQSGGATAFVKGFGDDLVGLVNADGSLGEKQQRIRPLIDQDVDVDGIARFCLGRFASTATPQQITEFTRLFHAVLVENITSKVGDYRGVTFTVGTASQRGTETLVSSIVKRPNNAPNNVQWVVEASGPGMKIVDVVAEGTSLRLTQRSDYASFLGQHGGDVGSLITAMKAQVRAG